MCKKKRSLKMPKKVLISVVLVLLLSSGVFAKIGQVEGFSIGASNLVKRVGGKAPVVAGTGSNSTSKRILGSYGITSCSRS